MNSKIFFRKLQSDSPEIHLLNVEKVRTKGLTGKGIVVAVVDDGVIEDCNDLKDNYVSSTRITTHRV